MEVHHHKHGAIRDWREFAKEVGIIVLGVVIALGGEQAVEAIHHHYQVRDLQAALDQEVAWDLASMRETVALGPCVNRRVDELDRWLRSQSTGQPLKLTGDVANMVGRSFRTAVWRSATGSTIDLIPLRRRIAYAQLYDGVDNNARIRSTAGTELDDLSLLASGESLNAEQRMRFAHDLKNLRTQVQIMASNYQTWLDVYAKPLGVRPDDRPLPGDTRGMSAARVAFCKPILAS